jgi:hypothetical protein
MQLPRSALSMWEYREKAQGERLRRGLRGHHQQSYRFPGIEIAGLRAKHRLELGCTNPYARLTWQRTLGAHLFRHLGATAPSWRPAQPVYLMTLLDRTGQDPREDDCYGDPFHPSNLNEILARYRGHLACFNGVGMIDVAPYVSAARLVGANRVYFLHAHALVWGASEHFLELAVKRLRPRFRSLLPYTTSVDLRRIRTDDLRQMLWYVTKTPNKQYQAWVDPRTGRHRQADRAMNFVNAVRLHAVMGHVTLDELTIAGGEGEAVVKAVLADVQRR